MARARGRAGRGELLGAPYSAAAWAAAVHPDDAAAFAEACQRAARGEPSEVSYRIVRADGETREIWYRFAPSRGGTVAGVRVDVTERRTTERQLSSARHRLESVLRQLDDVVVTLEVLPDGSVVGGDPLGDADESALLRDENVHPDDLEAFGTALDAIRRGERVAIGIRHVTDDGPLRRLLLRSVPRDEPDGRRFADVIVSDVTDRADRESSEMLGHHAGEKMKRSAPSFSTSMASLPTASRCISGVSRRPRRVPA